MVNIVVAISKLVEIISISEVLMLRIMDAMFLMVRVPIAICVLFSMVVVVIVNENGKSTDRGLVLDSIDIVPKGEET